MNRLALAFALPVMVAAAPHPEARPFGRPEQAPAEVQAALARAAATSRRVLLVFGANWCHDSRALAGWFATPRFKTMLADRYELVWINVGDAPGEKDRNGDLARRFGLAGIAGTPTVLILDAAGKPLNLSEAPGWKNAASRSGDAIYAAFANN